MANGDRAIVDAYLPYVIGLDTLLQTRLLDDVLTLNSVTVEPIVEEDTLPELSADRPTALYLA